MKTLSMKFSPAAASCGDADAKPRKSKPSFGHKNSQWKSIDKNRPIQQAISKPKVKPRGRFLRGTDKSKLHPESFQTSGFPDYHILLEYIICGMLKKIIPILYRNLYKLPSKLDMLNADLVKHPGFLDDMSNFLPLK